MGGCWGILTLQLWFTCPCLQAGPKEIPRAVQAWLVTAGRCTEQGLPSRQSKRVPFLQEKLWRSWSWQWDAGTAAPTVPPQSPPGQALVSTPSGEGCCGRAAPGPAGWCVGQALASSHQVRGIQHCHPCCHPPVRVLDGLRAQQVPGSSVHHHLLVLPAKRRAPEHQQSRALVASQTMLQVPCHSSVWSTCM